MRLRPLPALARHLCLFSMVAGGFWAAWLWEVPALLALGTHPEMQTRHLPRAWEAPVSLEQLNQRQGHRLSDSDQRSLAGVPATSLCLVFYACAFSTFWKRERGDFQGEVGNIWVERDFESSRWTFRKKNPMGEQVRRSSSSRGWSRQEPRVSLLFPGPQEDSVHASWPCSGPFSILELV